MSTLLQTEWPVVKKEVNGALSLDFGGGGPHLAYRTYLDCLVKLLSLLRRDATTAAAAETTSGAAVPPELVTQRRNFVKLAKQCLDRVNDLADSATPPIHGGGGGGGPTTKVVAPSSVATDDVTLLLPDVPCDFLSEKPTETKPATNVSSSSSFNPTSSSSNARSSSSPAPPPPAGRNDGVDINKARPNDASTSSASTPSSTPTNAPAWRIGSRHLPNVNLAQNQKATLNMAAFRKMEEQREIAKKTRIRMEQRLKERKKALEEDAMERFAEDGDKAKFFAAAALMEQDDAVLGLLRKRLGAARQTGDLDEQGKCIDALLDRILDKMPAHPLTELVLRHQRMLMSRLKPLITPYIRDLDSVVVPYVEPDKNASSDHDRENSAAAMTTTTTTGSSAPGTPPRPPPPPPPPPLSAEETGDDTDSASASPPPRDNTAFVAELERQNFERQKVDILESEAIERHLDAVSQDVRMAVEVIMSKLTLLYGEEAFAGEDAAAARDRAYVTVEKVFFKPLWPLLINMFRLGNKLDEVQLAKIMTNNMDLSPEDVGISPQLCLSSTSSPSSSSRRSHPHVRRHGFEPVIAELHRLATLSSPLSKLECLVLLCKVVCRCVDDIKSANAAAAAGNAAAEMPPPGSLGADDLLPILSFAILRSNLPQLASESRAMSEFIHESYQMGEEGYCLISVQTAIGYLMRLDDDG